MNKLIEKILRRLEETDLNDIQMVVREVLLKYGFPYESVVQDEVWDALDELSTNKFAISIIQEEAKAYNDEVKGDLISKTEVFKIIEKEKSLRCGYDTDIALLSVKKSIAELPTVGSSNDGWIRCKDELPPMPKENQLFENKTLELYLVAFNETDYPFRAFWNGKFFTDGFSKVEPIAWKTLDRYKENENG